MAEAKSIKVWDWPARLSSALLRPRSFTVNEYLLSIPWIASSSSVPLQLPEMSDYAYSRAGQVTPALGRPIWAYFLHRYSLITNTTIHPVITDAV